MSKAFKKNKVMIISLSLAGVVALGLVVYLGIKLLEWNGYRGRTQKAIEEIRTLVNQKPAPGRENEDRIKEDIQLYEEKSTAMIGSFKSPLDKALDAFFEELQPPRIEALSDEEKETYKEEGTGVEASEDQPEIPLKIRKFTREDFLNFFSGRFAKFCESNNISEEDSKKLTILNQFRTEFVRLFPDGNWKQAISKFAEVARDSINEPIEITNTQEPLPLLMQALGLERRVAPNPHVHVENMIENIIIPAASGKIELGKNALQFIGGYSDNLRKKLEKNKNEDNANSGNSGNVYSEVIYLPEEYPFVYFHWEVFGDIVKRLASAKVKSLEQVKFRAVQEDVSSEGSGNNQSNRVNISLPTEEDGNYKLYHYTIVFTGNMTAVREAMRQFDLAWKSDSRMYIVRGIALYARHDGASDIAGSATEVESSENTGDQSSGQPVKRGRRRRRIQVQDPVETETRPGDDKDKPIELTRELHYRVMLNRRQKAGDNEFVSEFLNRLAPPESSVENNNGNPSSSEGGSSDESVEEILQDLEGALKPHERFGYGKTLIGSDGKADDDCLVYLDVDYVVLNQQK